jgi:hypothetical protein
MIGLTDPVPATHSLRRRIRDSYTSMTPSTSSKSARASASAASAPGARCTAGCGGWEGAGGGQKAACTASRLPKKRRTCHGVGVGRGLEVPGGRRAGGRGRRLRRSLPERPALRARRCRAPATGRACSIGWPLQGGLDCWFGLLRGPGSTLASPWLSVPLPHLDRKPCGRLAVRRAAPGGARRLDRAGERPERRRQRGCARVGRRAWHAWAGGGVHVHCGSQRDSTQRHSRESRKQRRRRGPPAPP